MPPFKFGHKYVDRLVNGLETSPWPVRREQVYRDQILLHRAFRESMHELPRPIELGP